MELWPRISTNKINEVKHFLQSKKPHCLGVIESDLFGHQSQTNRVKYTTAELKEILRVDGYNIEFPNSWENYGQARLICYVSEEIKYSRRILNENFDHLPTITLDIGLGKAAKTVAHFLHAPRVQESTFRLYIFICLYNITCYFSCVSLVQTYCYELYHI